MVPATEPARRQLRLDFDLALEVPVLVYVGRLAPEKELRSLLEAFALLRETSLEAQLILEWGTAPSAPCSKAKPLAWACARRYALPVASLWTGYGSI